MTVRTRWDICACRHTGSVMLYVYACLCPNKHESISVLLNLLCVSIPLTAVSVNSLCRGTKSLTKTKMCEKQPSPELRGRTEGGRILCTISPNHVPPPALSVIWVRVVAFRTVREACRECFWVSWKEWKTPHQI